MVKLTQDSIHAIVLGFSSAIIVEKDIREEFKYKNVCQNDIELVSIYLSISSLLCGGCDFVITN